MNCSVEFAQVDEDQRYCSRKCRKMHQNALRQSRKVILDSVSTDEIAIAAAAVTSSTPTTPRTRSDIALNVLSADDRASLYETGARYSESTLRKHKYAEKMYLGYMAYYTDVSPWPLDPRHVAEWVRFLGLHAKYAIGSLESVFIPAIKRLHIEYCSAPVPLEVHQFISQALKDVKNSKSHLAESQSKGPAIVNDVKRIIECIPEGHPDKAMEASLFLASLSTGARAVTCFNVHLADIISVYNVPGSNRIIVQLRYRVTKGNPIWNHIVSLEGDPTLKSSLNVVYWLVMHLKSRFGLDLLSFSTWDLSITGASEEKLWPYSKDCMRAVFKSRAALAGFPHDLFCFHSLRAGFLCSAILKAGTDANAVRAVLENTAFVAGWVPNQAAQLRYVKTCAKKTIISSRLILPVEENDEANVIEPLLMSSEAFHNIRLSEPSWDPDTNYKSFQQKVDKIFTIDALEPEMRKALKDKCWRNAFNAYVLADPILEAEARSIYLLKPAWKIARSRFGTELNSREYVGRRHMAQMLNENYSLVHGLVNQFVSLVRAEIELEKPVRKCTRTRPVKPVESGIVRERSAQTGHRKRIPWTRDEDVVLVQEHHRGFSWKNISSLLADRTNVDCKDRYRNLVIKFGDVPDLLASHGLE